MCTHTHSIPQVVSVEMDVKVLHWLSVFSLDSSPEDGESGQARRPDDYHHMVPTLPNGRDLVPPSQV